MIVLGLLVIAVLARADTGFLKSLSAGERMGAGLQNLTPEQQVRLEALVQRYKTGEVTGVPHSVESREPVAPQESARTDAVDVAKARDVGVEASGAATAVRMGETKAAAGPAEKPPGWYAALVALNSAKEKQEPLVSRLAGDFEGWNGRSIFSLENGTRWVQQNKTDSYVYSPLLHSPKAKITPAAIGGFWLEIEGVNRSVRVIPLELAGQK